MSHTNPANGNADIEPTNQLDPLLTAGGITESAWNTLRLPVRSAQALNMSTFRQLLQEQQPQEEEEEKVGKEQQPAAEAEASTAGDTPQEDGESAEQPTVASPESERTVTAAAPAPKAAASKSWTDLVRSKSAFSAFMEANASDNDNDNEDNEDIDPAVDSSVDGVADGEEWENLSRASSSSLDDEDADDQNRMTWDEEELERRQRNHEQKALTEQVDANRKAILELNSACEVHKDILLDFECETLDRLQVVETRMICEWQEVCNRISSLNHYLEPCGSRMGLKQLVEASQRDIVELQDFRNVVEQNNMEFMEELEAQTEKTSSAVKYVRMLDVRVAEMQDKLTETLDRVSECTKDVKRAENLVALTVEMSKKHEVAQDAHDAKLSEQAEKVNQLHTIVAQDAKRQRDEQEDMKGKLTELETLHDELELSQVVCEKKTNDRIQEARTSMNTNIQSSSNRSHRRISKLEERNRTELAQQSDRTKALEDMVQALCDRLEQAFGRIEQLESEKGELKRLKTRAKERSGEGIQKEQSKRLHDADDHADKMNRLRIGGTDEVGDRLARLSNLRAEVESFRLEMGRTVRE